MRIAVFSAHSFETPFLLEANKSHHHALTFFNERLTAGSAQLAAGFPAVSCFVTDCLDAEVLKTLADNGTRLIALRSAGFNHINLTAAKQVQLLVTYVPRYSPYAVAEFAAGLVLSLNRRIPEAYDRVKNHNFSLEGLLGFDLYGKTVGVIGTGAIGTVFAKIMLGFGCRVLAYDLTINLECQKAGVEYVTLPTLYQQADIISLHCPLTPETHYLIDEQALDQMKNGVMLINTGRGTLLNTIAVIKALESGQIGYLGIDVYEKEADLFFRDLSHQPIQDEIFLRLQSFPNVLITGHQAFFTREALMRIAQTTLENVTAFAANASVLPNQITSLA